MASYFTGLDYSAIALDSTKIWALEAIYAIFDRKKKNRRPMRTRTTGQPFAHPVTKNVS
jgi:hypothetical protein